jgi:uncharacterized protein (DUF58 family)
VTAEAAVALVILVGWFVLNGYIWTRKGGSWWGAAWGLLGLVGIVLCIALTPKREQERRIKDAVSEAMKEGKPKGSGAASQW